MERFSKFVFGISLLILILLVVSGRVSAQSGCGGYGFNNGWGFNNGCCWDLSLLPDPPATTKWDAPMDLEDPVWMKEQWKAIEKMREDNKAYLIAGEARLKKIIAEKKKEDEEWAKGAELRKQKAEEERVARAKAEHEKFLEELRQYRYDNLPDQTKRALATIQQLDLNIAAKKAKSEAEWEAQKIQKEREDNPGNIFLKFVVKPDEKDDVIGN
ncbi:MAG: hypothetical protein NUV86_09750 [Candidatus Scalindua sp.]|nr:hypothetical protein [Candidatus Scalindua sp.]MCR4343945.1 hypothetical protein [Candidatus Scalindua sp.]